MNERIALMRQGVQALLMTNTRGRYRGTSGLPGAAGGYPLEDAQVAFADAIRDLAPGDPLWELGQDLMALARRAAENAAA